MLMMVISQLPPNAIHLRIPNDFRYTPSRLASQNDSRKIPECPTQKKGQLQALLCIFRWLVQLAVWWWRSYFNFYPIHPTFRRISVMHQIVWQGRRIPGNSAKCRKDKRDNFRRCLVHFSNFPSRLEGDVGHISASTQRDPPAHS